MFLDVARPPGNKFCRGINLGAAGAAHPLQNCRLYFSQIQMEPRHAITHNNSNTYKKVIYRTFVTNNYPPVAASGSFNQLLKWRNRTSYRSAYSTIFSPSDRNRKQ